MKKKKERKNTDYIEQILITWTHMTFDQSSGGDTSKYYKI